MRGRRTGSQLASPPVLRLNPGGETRTRTRATVELDALSIAERSVLHDALEPVRGAGFEPNGRPGGEIESPGGRGEQACLADPRRDLTVGQVVETLDVELSRTSGADREVVGTGSPGSPGRVEPADEPVDLQHPRPCAAFRSPLITPAGPSLDTTTRPTPSRGTRRPGRPRSTGPAPTRRPPARAATGTPSRSP